MVLKPMFRRVPRQLNIKHATRVSNLATSLNFPTSTKVVITPTKMPPNDRAEKQAAAQQAVNILHEISTILVSGRATIAAEAKSIDKQLQNCHLDRQTLSICISMIEKGINPEALAVSVSRRGTQSNVPLGLGRDSNFTPAHTLAPPRSSSSTYANHALERCQRIAQERPREPTRGGGGGGGIILDNGTVAPEMSLAAVATVFSLHQPSPGLGGLEETKQRYLPNER